MDVAEIDADAKAHAPRFVQRLVAPGDLALGIGRGSNRACGAGKDRQHAVARHVDHAPAIGLYALAEDLAAGGKCGDGGRRIVGHQPGIARNIRRQYRRQALRDALLGHAVLRVPGAGGSWAAPAKHWALAIQAVALGPVTLSLVSAILRVCVTTWQNSSARPSMRSAPLSSP